MKYFFLLIFLAYNINLRAQGVDISNDCSEALKSIIASLDPKGTHRQAAEEFLNAQVELTQQRLLWAHLKYLAELKKNDPKINAQTHKIEDGILKMLSEKHNPQIETSYNNLSQRLALSELSDDLLQIVQDQEMYKGDEQQLYKLNHSDLFMIHTLGKLETDLLNGRSAQGNLDNTVNKNTLINLATQINSSLGVTNQKSHASNDIESHINTTTKYIVDLEIKAKSAFNKMFDGQGVPDICQKDNESSSQSCSRPIVKFGSLYEMFQLSQKASQIIETKFYSDIKEDLYKNLYYCSHYPHVCADKVQACTKTCQANDSICHKKCMGEDVVIKDRSFKCAPPDIKKTNPTPKPITKPIPDSPVNPIIQKEEKNIKITTNTNTSNSVINNNTYNYTITNTNNQITSAAQVPNKPQAPIIIIKDNSEERTYSVNTIAGDPNVYVISIDKKQAPAAVVPSPNPVTPDSSPKSNEKAADSSSEKKECKDIPGCHAGFTFSLDLKIAEQETNKAIDFKGYTSFEYADEKARLGIPQGYYLVWTIDGKLASNEPLKSEQKQARIADQIKKIDQKIAVLIERMKTMTEEGNKFVTDQAKREELQLAQQENKLNLDSLKKQKEDLEKKLPSDVSPEIISQTPSQNIPCLYEAEKVNFENILRNQPKGNYTVKLTLYSPEGEEILSETQEVKARAAASPGYDPNKISGGANNIGTGIQVH